MKWGILIALTISFTSFSLSAKTVETTRYLQYTVVAEAEAVVLIAVKEVISFSLLGKKSDSYGCKAVMPLQISVVDVSVNKKYRVGSDNNLNPYYEGQINYSQKFRCHEGSK